MNRRLYILYIILAATLVACQNDDTEVLTGPVEYCVKAVWENGRETSHTRYAHTRAMGEGILAGGIGNIEIPFTEYPSQISVHCSDANDFVMNRAGRACDSHSTFWRYTPSREYDIETIEKNTLTFTATAVIDDDGAPATTDDGDRLEGSANKNNITGDKHLQFTLRHTKTLVRFAFKVAEKYDRIRYIKIKDVKLNGATATYPVEMQALVLNASESLLLCYLYIDPTKVTVSTSLTLACTYDVYDKDARTLLEKGMTTTLTQAEQAELASHLTRGNVSNSHTFSFQKIYTDDAKTQHVGSIQAGKYYDLFVTIDPDFLYTLSNHDNKSAISVE